MWPTTLLSVLFLWQTFVKSLLCGRQGCSAMPTATVPPCGTNSPKVEPAPQVTTQINSRVEEGTVLGGHGTGAWPPQGGGYKLRQVHESRVGGGSGQPVQKPGSRREQGTFRKGREVVCCGAVSCRPRLGWGPSHPRFQLPGDSHPVSDHPQPCRSFFTYTHPLHINSGNQVPGATSSLTLQQVPGNFECQGRLTEDLPVQLPQLHLLSAPMFTQPPQSGASADDSRHHGTKDSNIPKVMDICGVTSNLMNLAVVRG